MKLSRDTSMLILIVIILQDQYSKSLIGLDDSDSLCLIVLERFDDIDQSDRTFTVLVGIDVIINFLVLQNLYSFSTLTYTWSRL